MNEVNNNKSHGGHQHGHRHHRHRRHKSKEDNNHIHNYRKKSSEPKSSETHANSCTDSIPLTLTTLDDINDSNACPPQPISFIATQYESPSEKHVVIRLGNKAVTLTGETDSIEPSAAAATTCQNDQESRHVNVPAKCHAFRSTLDSFVNRNQNRRTSR